MGLRDRVRTLERKALQRGVQVNGPRLFRILPRDPERRARVQVARVRGRYSEIVGTWERYAAESVEQFADRVELDAERVCRHRPDGMILIHFGETINAADSFYAYN